MQTMELKDLLDAGVHFGHQTRRWNPKMKPYIFLERAGIYILDLEKTMEGLDTAREAVRQVVAAGGSVLFVATKKQAKDVMIEEAKRCGQYYVTERWLGGMLTNFQTIRQSIRYLRTLDRMVEDGTMEKLTKKEASRLGKARIKLEANFSGIKDMNRVPGLMFIVDTKKEHLAVMEAQRLSIPSIGVVDTNADPEEVTYPIPGNDDAIRAIRLYTRYISDAILEARASAPSQSAQEKPKTYNVSPNADKGRGVWSSERPAPRDDGKRNR
jgi:small subunit ribosomal protein S2